MTDTVRLNTENHLQTEFKELLRSPEERQAYADAISSKYKAGDLIFSVLWFPAPKFDPYINIGMLDRSVFFEMVDEFIAVLSSELKAISATIEYDVVYEARVDVSDQIHIIMSCPEQTFSSNLSKFLWLNEKWDVVSYNYNKTLYGEISIEATGSTTNVDGWLYQMFKPYISEVEILPGKQVPI